MRNNEKNPKKVVCKKALWGITFAEPQRNYCVSS